MVLAQQEPIAIVGTGCRFPGGANSPSSLWKLLEKPYDVGVEIGPDRFNARTFYHPEGSHHGTSNVLRSYLLDEDVRLFDAAFFNLSPNEADSMDPQQRLLLEVVYEALEAGGHTLEALRGSNTAVYVGTMTADYNDTLTRDHNSMPNYFATGTNRAIISNRVSYFFDWHGPSMTIDTACSSSLIAVHQGVKALRTGESRVAVACGTQVLLNPEMYIGESNLKMLSPNGRSAMWSEDADGYARGEGVAAVVLKTLSDAIADGDYIECIIRETGANQDGFSNGLTVPSTEAQASLIRQTYARAGLDPENEPRDRPQFFEAHGTGTQAGDPKEAAAIFDCFGRHMDDTATSLYVGSVKTVIGHLEGCAGLAGLIKSSAMINSGYIPPNLHFNRLNPRVEPFYKGLNVPTQLIRWPELPQEVPRRVSVNSFGFGGTNAHAILEQYQPAVLNDKHHDESPSISLAPFIFSASSEASLIAQLHAFSSHLKSHHASINPSHLAWTLNSRRSQLSTKVAFSALTIEQLTSKIDAKLTEANQNAGATVGFRSNVKPGAARLLGIFTGQGAQWPAMGAHLIRSSHFVAQRIQYLEDSLASLPASDRPAWSLREEILAGEGVSRIAEAALSQPLCTAIQVVLIDLLRSAGITFTAVVGHSSGEIAAAYAAGFLSAHDAICIAYYRGVCARLAGNEKTGQKGSMIATGISWEEARRLVDSENFKGRLAVAAHNSPASVTLSGDADAVAEAKRLFDGEKKFARVLKVDTAYHSHHMLPCGESYVAALRTCGVRVNRERADTSCTWYSSVTGSRKGMEPIDGLQDTYWKDNMTNAVLFSEAIMNAVNGSGHLDLAIEVGPHPALKGPATQNISEVRSSHLPYCGVLSRGKNDVEAFADALGFVWTQLPHLVDFQAFEKALASDLSRQSKLVLGLPSYQWNHGRSHWAESRISRRMRTRKHAHHEILGFLSTESNLNDMRWSNVLKQKEISWLDGHQLQGQTVFPAAGYVAMALEASRVLAGGKSVELFELHQLTIPKAITFEEGDNLGVETLVALTGIEYQHERLATADFACFSVPVSGAGSEHDMELTASGTIKIVFGTPNASTLCPLPPDDYNMSVVEVEYFYKNISTIGYNYSGHFSTLSSAKRRLNKSSALVDSYSYSDNDMSEYMVHPSMLDVAFQASILAYSAPGDGRLWSLSVPTAIGTIRVNPEVCAALPTSGSKVPVYAVLDGVSESFSASIDLMSEDGEHTMVQVEDLTLKPFGPATQADDRSLFTHTKFDFALPDVSTVVNGVCPSVDEVDLATSCERLSYYYLRKWKSELTDAQSTHDQHHPHWKQTLDWVLQTLSAVSSDRYVAVETEWSESTLQDIQALIARYPESVDVKLLVTIDQNLSAAIRKNSPLEHMVPKDMLEDWYKKGLGFATYQNFLASLMKQLVHRYPHARILEIGAGTGEATQSVLASLEGKFSSYTYTDISADLISKAAGKFKTHHKEKMNFAVLDIDASPANQDFHPHSYEIVIASHVLTATASFQTALQNIRSLLKPGGYLMLEEVIGPSSLRCHSILSSALGWWLGANADRKSSPLLTPGNWHYALRQTGFGGVDAYIPEIDHVSWPLSIIASQAVDDRVQFLRRPLSSALPSSSTGIESLVILGNSTLETARIGDEVAEYLGRFCGETIILNGLPTEEDLLSLHPQSTFVNLVDIDSPIFKDLTDEKMEGLKRMVELAKHILWVTHGGHVDQPYQMASIAFGRCIRQEAGHILFNHMDVSDLGHNLPKAIAEYLLQQCVLEEWEAPPSTMAGRLHQDFGFLWSREPEVFFDHGKLKVLRHVTQNDQNARLNSSRRIVRRTVPISGTNVEIIAQSSDSRRFAVAQVDFPRKESSEVEIVRLRSSSLQALHLADDTFLFLGTGKGKDGLLQIFLSATNSSEVSPVASVAMKMNASANVDANDLLIAIVSEVLAESLIQQFNMESRVLIRCSGKDRFFADAFSRQAAARSIHVQFVCEGQDEKRDTSWTQLDARSPNQVLRKMLHLMKPTHFLDLTTSISSSDLSRRISRALPLSCRSIDTSTLFRSEASCPSRHNLKALSDRLENAVLSAESSLLDGRDLVISLGQLQNLVQEYATSIVRWPLDDELVEVEVRPLDARYLFSKDKTYLLVGLSGQIGQSLCEWMVANGAGCVCLTSRHPKVDQAWLDSFRDTDATVKVMALDVLDMSSIKHVVEEIRTSCPPIAGVANGAVIFDDQLFANMSGAVMRKVLGPKVDGSNNLDQAFYDDDLDFFILFSSTVKVIGNAGQSNYAAANGYMNGLVRQRRRRGLAASSLNLGRVAGIGYAEAAGQEVQEQLVKKLGLPPISETDLRHIFAETIQAGFQRPDDFDSTPNALITTGLRIFRDDEDLRGPWFNNSFFSHLVEESGNAASSSDGADQNAALPVGQRLSMATTNEAALIILKDAFSDKLRSLLQLGSQTIEHDAPLLELGIDSLVAVEVRSWFLKSLKVDIPVLRVVSGASLSELCQKALEKLPEELVTNASNLTIIPKQQEEARPPKAVVIQEPQLQRLVQGSVLFHSTVTSSASSDSPEAQTLDTPMTTATAPSASESVADPQESSSDKSKGSAVKFVRSERLSLPQSRFWFLRQLLEDPTTSNVIFSYHVTGNIRVGDLERAIRSVTNRHEALRTCFVEDETDDGEAYQRVLPTSLLRLERKKISSSKDVDAEYSKLRQHVFDIERGDVMRITLLTLSSTSHYLLIIYHHIIMDGASFNIFLSDLDKAYKGQSLGAAPRQYPEFSVAQRRALEKGDMHEELKYWRTVFPANEQPPVLPLLPMARTSSRVTMNGFDSHQVVCTLEPDLTARVKKLSKSLRSTPFHLHLAAFKALLFSLTGDKTKDLTIGIADAARNDSDLEGSIGFFLNLLTLRFRQLPDQSFADAVVEARDIAYSALRSSRLPFDVLLTELNVARSSLHSPFFQAFLDYRQGVQERHPWGNCQFELQNIHPGRTAYDLTLDVTEVSATETVVMFRVQKSLYDLTAANLLLKTYSHFLNVLTKDASLPLKVIPHFSDSQLAQAVQIGRGDELVSDWPETLPLRIDQIAQENKDQVALMDGTGKILTYSDMTHRIEAISEALRDAGVKDGSRVLVYQQPATDWTCSMLAIMRIGAVYVPLDLRNPLNRLSAVAQDCNPSAILADATTIDTAPQLQAVNAVTINVSDLPLSATNHIVNCSQSHLPAAILYTSGSTGTPKGITVTHSGLRNEIEGYTKTWGLGAERVLQQSAFTFNHSSDQMYTGLVNGGMVYIVPADKRGDPVEITKILLQHSITYTKATPSEYSMWIQFGGDALRRAFTWRFAFGGGEPLTNIVTQEFADLKLPQLRFFNSYGPTEISISSHKIEILYTEKVTVENMGRIPCGYSLPNYYTYVVDEQLRPVPIGMPGEICIGGAGVSRGYLNNEELTSKCFVLNPFATPEDISRGWTRMYRTGDIGHLREDGAMIFHSRMAGDSQVKIRGLRIELSDIESNIITAAGGVLREAVVTLRDGNPPLLVAHVVFAPQHSISNKESFLQNLLSSLPIPQYMVPVVAIPLDKFPLSNHSKVDRKAIQNMPLPIRSSKDRVVTELTETMVQLKRIWRDVLGKNLDRFGFELNPTTNFFLVGGNSLLVIRLQAHIRQVFHVAVPLVKLLGASTLEEMASKIEESESLAIIDWEKETRPPSIPRFLHDLPLKEETTAKTILITGGTGFLGKYILPQLAARPDIEMIHCVAVRDKPRDKTPFSSPKVAYHVGDLSLPLLGLGVDEFRGLASQVDVIFHMGAVRSFWDNYHVLHASNVNPVRELVSLAGPRRVPIHYISTAGVLPWDEAAPTVDNANSAATHLPLTDGSNGYVSSKWAAERILERSAETLGVPSSVYRFLPASRPQPSDKQALLDALVQFVDASGLVPDVSVWKGRMDMIPAEEIVRWLIESVVSPTTLAPLAGAAAATRFFHYESPVAIHADELRAHIEQVRGSRGGFESMPILKWFGRLKALGFNYLLASQEAVVGGGHGGQVLVSRR